MGADSPRPAIVVHGGAGRLIPDVAESRRIGVRQAATRGWDVLSRGGSSVEAVEEAVRLLEDDPAFNAGRGACLNRDGEIELDASIMSGRDLEAGAIGAVTQIPNPISLARALMEAGRHVLLVGEGARRFAAQAGIASCPPESLVTARQRARWAEQAAADRMPGGTVGAVARDRTGSLAAATSTGGLPFKAPGRVGDSALIGCGTYADDRLGAASCTGDGDAIIKLVLARTALEHLAVERDPMAAAKRAIDLLTARTGADAGIILIDPIGRIGHARNTAQMTCAYVLGDGSPVQVID
jgi:beta-aspartyl-peptidase (threonine type)